MPYAYIIDKPRRLVISTALGTVTFSEITSQQDRLLSDPNFDATFNQLIDATATTRLELTAEEARIVADRKVFSTLSKRAVVASKPDIFGMSRMIEAHHRHSEVTVFYLMHDACEWLGLRI